MHTALRQGVILAISLSAISAFIRADTTTIAIEGASTPGGFGGPPAIFGASFGDPVTNNAGQIGFWATTTGGGDYTEGIFRESAGTLRSLARRGGSAPGGGPNGINGRFERFLQGDLTINSTGIMTFRADLAQTSGGTTNDFGVFRIDAEGSLRYIGLEGSPAFASSGGGSVTLTADASFVTLNNNGQMAYSSTFNNGTGHAVLRGEQGSPSYVARTFSGTGNFTAFRPPLMAPAGVVVFHGTRAHTTLIDQGLYRTDGSITTTLARTGGAAPGGTWGSFEMQSLIGGNDALFRGTVITNQGEVQGIFRAGAAGATEFARQGSSAPDSAGTNGAFQSFGTPAGNSAGQVAFYAELSNTAAGSADDIGLFRFSSNTLAQVVRKGQVAPGGQGTFASFTQPAILSGGQVLFSATLDGSSRNSAMYLADPREMIEVVRVGDSAEDSTIASFSAAISPLPGRGGFNDLGQVVYRASLADGRSLIRKFTPELHWRSNAGGNWTDADNWSLGLPVASVHPVLIDAPVSVTVQGPTAETIVKTLTIGGTAGATSTLNLTASVSASKLLVGHVPGGQGVLNLNPVAGGALNVPDQQIGGAGSGTVIHARGINLVTNLIIGGGAGSGSYQMTGPGAVFVRGNETIGTAGSGSFIQRNGQNEITGSLLIGAPGGGAATYELSGQGILVASSIINRGTFTQSGGTATGPVTNNGTMNLIGGTFNSPIDNPGTINANSGGTFIARNGITNSGRLNVNDGAKLEVWFSNLNSSGILDFRGGTITLSAPLINDGQISGFGKIAGTYRLENNGTFTQGAGDFSIPFGDNFGAMHLAQGRQLLFTNANFNNRGVINLNGAIVRPTAPASLGNTATGRIYGSGTITAGFVNSGILSPLSGTIHFPDGTWNTNLIEMETPTSTLTGGNIFNTGTIRGQGTISNSIDGDGLIDAIGGSLTLGGAVGPLGTKRINNGATLVASAFPVNRRLIELVGGTFDTSGAQLINEGTITGHGKLRTGRLLNSARVTFTGGPSTISGNFSNLAFPSGGQVQVIDDPAFFMGDIVNDAAFTTARTSTTISGTYRGFGTYFSDSADTFFTDVLLTSSGALDASAGSRFFISGDLQYTQFAVQRWKTVLAELHLDGGDASHLLSIPGSDLGQSYAGYNDNFAWGLLELGSGDALTLENVGDSGGAIYVGALLLADGLPQLSSITSNGLNVYYDIRHPANSYLNAQTYALPGGGSVIPVPEPASAALALFAAAILCRRRRSASAGI